MNRNYSFKFIKCDYALLCRLVVSAIFTRQLFSCENYYEKAFFDDRMKALRSNNISKLDFVSTCRMKNREAVKLFPN